MNSQNIKKESRELLDKFGKDLEGVKLSDSKISKHGISFRKEGKGETCDKEFKAIMFKNAKHKNDKYLILEKGSWN
jgi:hypothetical protein